MRTITRSAVYLCLAALLASCASRPAAPLGSGIAKIGAINVPLHDPLWSPDGRQVLATHTTAIHTWTSEIYAIDVSSNKVRAIVQTDYGNLQARAWSPDGTRVAFSSDPGGEWPAAIWLVDVAGATPRQMLAPGYDAAWSPDGERIAVFSTSLDHDKETRVLSIIDLATGKTKQVYAVSAKYTTTMGLAWSPDGRRLAFSAAMQDTDQSPRFPHVDLYDLEISNSEITRITVDGVNASPRWSHTGSLLAYIRTSPGAIDWTLVIGSADGKCSRDLGTPADSVDWSLDGNRLVFSDDGTIYVMDLAIALGANFETPDSLCA